jgi:hypothetical protein
LKECLELSTKSLGVFAGFGVDADFVADVDEEGNLNFYSILEYGKFIFDHKYLNAKCEILNGEFQRRTRQKLRPTLTTIQTQVPYMPIDPGRLKQEKQGKLPCRGAAGHSPTAVEGGNLASGGQTGRVNSTLVADSPGRDAGSRLFTFAA